MHLVSLLEGVLIGFAGAAPVGPIWILCLQCAISQGKKAGLVVGLGGAVADSIYAAIALLGVSVISDFIALEHNSIRVFGGASLIALGLLMLRPRPMPGSPACVPSRQIPLFLSTTLLAFANPLPLFGFTTLLAALGLGTLTGGFFDSLPFITGIFIGSFGWFVVLASSGAAIRRNLPGANVVFINRAAAALLFALGIAALGN